MRQTADPNKSSNDYFNEADVHYKRLPPVLADSKQLRRELVEIIRLCQLAIEKDSRNGDAYVMLAAAYHMLALDGGLDSGIYAYCQPRAGAVIHRWKTAPMYTKNQSIGQKVYNDISTHTAQRYPNLVGWKMAMLHDQQFFGAVNSKGFAELEALLREQDPKMNNPLWRHMAGELAVSKKVPPQGGVLEAIGYYFITGETGLYTEWRAYDAYKQQGRGILVSTPLVADSDNLPDFKGQVPYRQYYVAYAVLANFLEEVQLSLTSNAGKTLVSDLDSYNPETHYLMAVYFLGEFTYFLLPFVRRNKHPTIPADLWSRAYIQS